MSQPEHSQREEDNQDYGPFKNEEEWQQARRNAEDMRGAMGDMAREAMPHVKRGIQGALWRSVKGWGIRTVVQVLPLGRRQKREIYHRLRRGEPLDRSIFLPRFTLWTVIRLIIMLVVLAVIVYFVLDLRSQGVNVGGF